MLMFLVRKLEDFNIFKVQFQACSQALDAVNDVETLS